MRFTSEVGGLRRGERAAMEHGGLYTGFDEFLVPNAEEIRSALQQGIVSLDTNVLLNLYRYNPSTVADLLSVVEKARARLFIPHQVAREFWRNRQWVIAGLGTVTREAHEALAKSSAATKRAINTWAARVALDASELETLLAEADRFFESVTDKIGEPPNSPSAQLPTSDDALLRKLTALLDGTVGPELPQQEWEEAVREGERRVANEEPPGYMDVKKLESSLPERASGDYLVWHQLLMEGERRRKDLVLVTSDTKEDWWNRVQGRPVGPRSELVGEYSRRTGGRFHLLEPADLLKHSSALGVGTSEESLYDIERIRNEAPSVEPWTPEALDAVLAKLKSQGYAQEPVIREAAGNGGRISRDRIYALDGRSQSQMLRGFTRPVTRVVEELQDDGLIPYRLAPLLEAVYEEGVKSSHFAVPAEVVEILKEE